VDGLSPNLRFTVPKKQETTQKNGKGYVSEKLEHDAPLDENEKLLTLRNNTKNVI
jgi:hypothetical protein